jgi:tetratricopeptide (TPR) repeat protein
MKALPLFFVILATPALAQPPATCNSGDYLGRIKVCTELLQQEQPSYKQAGIYIDRAHAYGASLQYDLAVKDYDLALGIVSDNVEALHGRASALQGLRQHERALADLDRLLTIGEVARYRSVHQSRCRSLAALGRFEEAIQSCTEQLKPYASPIFLYDRGDVLLKAGQPDRAIADFDAALQIDKNNTWAILGRGRALLAQKDYVAALAEFDRANKLSASLSGQDWGFALSGRGLAHEALGRREAAIADFQAALKAHRDLEEAMAGLQRLGASTTAPGQPTQEKAKPWWQFW